MTDVTFEILAGADDGLCDTDGSDFSAGIVYNRLGRSSASIYRSWFRFDNVTIPAGATITSAIIRFEATASDSANTVRLNVYFEDASDATAPTNGTDLLTRSLTSEVAWDSLPSWTLGNNYDTPDLASILQEVIDLGGWASGQAVQAHIIDDGGSFSADRWPSTYETDGRASAQLIVSYSVPYGIDISENVEISESISVASDLIKNENITVSENIEAEVEFIGELPTITENIEISEYVNVFELPLGDILNSELINLSESAQAEIETLPDYVTFEILSQTDDGYCGTDGANFQDTAIFGYIPFGRTSTRPYRSWYRFDNITIPGTAIIESAVLRVTSDTTVNWNEILNDAYFEAADDPAAPTDWTDLNSRSLGTQVAWDHTGYWYEDVSYDSPDLSSILQEVIDRPGWNLGQAVQIHLIDGGNTSEKYKRIQDWASTLLVVPGVPPQLVVAYRIPYGINVFDSVEISESVSLSKDKSPDVIDENIEISESVSMLRGFSGELSELENVSVSAYTNIALEFLGELTSVDSFGISLYRNVELGLELPTVFDSIVVSDSPIMEAWINVSDSINASESITIRRGYDKEQSDSFVLDDSFEAFNFTSWVRSNLSKAKVRFYCTITGDADLTTDAVVPIRSFYARKKSGDPSYLQVVVPGFALAGVVADRSNGDLVLTIGYEVGGVVSLSEQIAVVDIEAINTYDGGVNRSITISGHRTINYTNNLVQINSGLVTYRALVNNVLTFRFAYVDPYLHPGNTLVVGNDAMTVNSVVYIVDGNRALMEVAEA